MKRFSLAIFCALFYLSNLYALSPDMKLDMLKSKLAQQLKAEKYSDALVTMKQLKATKLKLPKSFAYFEGKALYESGQKGQAYKVLEEYLEKNGKKAKYYKQAINYMVNSEEAHKKWVLSEYLKKRKRQDAEDEIARKEELRQEKIATQKQQAEEFAKLKLTVNDINTGLMWTVPIKHKYESNPYLKLKYEGNRSEAEAFCNGLSLDDHSDWRIPSMKEFSTAYKENIHSVINWKDTYYNRVWLKGSSEFSKNGKKFSTNSIYLMSSNLFSSSSKYDGKILCVRTADSNKLDKYFRRLYSVIRFNGHAIMMEDTYLTGTDTVYLNDPSISYSEANNYCSGRVLAGYDDWRVPTHDDILNRIPCQYYKKMNFISKYRRDIWLVKPGVFSDDVGYLSTGKCMTQSDRSSSTHYVRCIRDILPEKKKDSPAENNAGEDDELMDEFE